MDLEGLLTGENLAFYKNIQDLKVLTANARSLINRSHALYNDVIQDDEFRRRIRGAEQEEDLQPRKSLHIGCSKCGLNHGVHDFCIVQEIIAAEKKHKESPRKSVATLSSYDQHDEGKAPPPKSLKIPKKEPSREKVTEWENLLYREMTPGELNVEYSKICNRYGVANGKKFLFARSLAQEQDAVGPLFTGDNQRFVRVNNDKSKIASITRDCLVQKKTGFLEPCSEFTVDVRHKMATVLDLELPCKIETPKQDKAWRNAFRAKPMRTTDHLETVEDDCSFSPSNTVKILASPSQLCHCRLEDCNCSVQTVCSPPEKKCLISTNDSNNYLYTVREKMNKRHLLASKSPPSGYHWVRQLNEVSYDVLWKESNLMLEKSHELRTKELKNCITSAIEKDADDLDKNVSKIAHVTSFFTKPDEKAWDRWIESFQVQEQVEDDEGISGDSDITTTRCSSSISSSSTTDREFLISQPSVKRIPFVEESFKLVDVMFKKIYTRFKKSVQKNSTRFMANRYKRFFFSHVDQLTALNCTGSIGDEVLDKLNLHFWYLKSLKPKTILKAQKLKRAKAKKKQLSKTICKRKRIECIQVGKRYRRSRKSVNFTKDRDYIGFNIEDRNLLQQPTCDRFAACDLVGDECGAMLSKKRIHYHYRLLRTLFSGPMDSEDKESLMDEGMRERLRKFKNTLHNGSTRIFETDSDTEDEGGSVLKAPSVPIRSPSKRDEKKLKSAPEYFAGTRSPHYSRMLSGIVNKTGLSEGACSITAKTSSRVSSKQINNCSLPSQTEIQSKPKYNSTSRWGDCRNPPSFLEGSFLKTGKTYSQISSEQSTHTTRSNQTEVRTKTFCKTSAVSNTSSQAFTQWKPYSLPTPPLSDSSCDEMDSDSIQRRFPPKDEAHMEKSARIDATAREQQIKKVYESELTDKSSDSYVPKLLKMPPNKTSGSRESLSNHALDQRVRGHFRGIRRGARPLHLPDSSSSDSEPVNPLRNARRGRPAWDHKSSMGREVAPYIDTNSYAKEHYDVPGSGRRTANYESQRTHNLKRTFTSPLPKAGRSILKNALPKPPTDDTCENQSQTPVLGINPLKRQSFSDSSYRTTSRPSEGLIKPARVVTERLLKATQGNEDDMPAGSTKKPSVSSRATPDGMSSSPISGGGSMKTSAGPMLGVLKTGNVQTEDDDSSPRQLPSVTIKQPKGSVSHHTQDKSADDDTGHVGESDHLQTTGSLTASLSKQLSRRTSSKVVSEVFRRRSLVPSDQIAKEPHKKAKAAKKDAVNSSLQHLSNSSVAAKLKKLEAIGPTKKRCFDVDIGQGINCINYLKENAPGADATQKKELVDLLVTPVEVKKVPKKAPVKVEQEASLEMAKVMSEQSAQEHTSSSSSLLSAHQSSIKNRKLQGQILHNESPLRKSSFKTLDQIYKEVHGINKNNTPRKLLDNDYEYEEKVRQQLTKHKIFPYPQEHRI